MEEVQKSTEQEKKPESLEIELETDEVSPAVATNVETDDAKEQRTKKRRRERKEELNKCEMDRQTDGQTEIQDSEAEPPHKMQRDNGHEVDPSLEDGKDFREKPTDSETVNAEDQFMEEVTIYSFIFHFKV